MSIFNTAIKASASVAILVGITTAAFAGDPPAAYTKSVLTQIMGKVNYPKIAKVRNQQGVVTLNVTIDGSGAVKAAAVDGSSGVESLDAAAIQAAKEAAPFPAPPDGGAEVHGNIKFSLDN